MADEHHLAWAATTAERALAYLKQLRLPPTPNHFELLFAYAAGHNHRLNRALRRSLKMHAGLPEAEVQRLLEEHLPQHRLNEKIQLAGAEMAAELADILEQIKTASHSTGELGQSLQRLLPQLDRIATADQLKLVVSALIGASHAMAENSQQLEARIAASSMLIQDRYRDLEALRAESLTDELTGVANREGFGQMLKTEMLQAAETGAPLCLALVEIDHVEALAAEFGHQIGDQLLRLIAQMLQRQLQAVGSVSRYAAEQFALLFPDMTLSDAAGLADGIRKVVTSRALVRRSSREPLGFVTLSIGIAAYRPGETPESLIRRADKYLEAAKQNGRDRVECEAPSSQAKGQAA